MSNEVSFIKEVEKHECLYNNSLPDYNRREGLEQAWAEVARSRNLTVAECKDKWRNIRSSLLRSLKRSDKAKKPYYLRPYLQFVVPFMRFRDEYTEEAQRDSQILHENEREVQITPVKLEQDSEDGQNPFDGVEVFESDNMLSENVSMRCSTSPDERASPVYQKRKRKIISRNTDNRRATFKRKHSPHTTYSTQSNNFSNLNNSSMRYFLLSLLPDFQTMSEEQVRMFKIKVMLLIDEIKSNLSEVQQNCRSSNETERLQKRLINLLLRNLKKNC